MPLPIKINPKDRALNAKQKASLKELDRAHSLAKARLSFKKISNVSDAYSLFGFTGTLEEFKGTDILTFQNLEFIYISLWNRVCESVETKVDKKTHTVVLTREDEVRELTLGTIWIDKDAYIESDFALEGTDEKTLYDSIIPPKNKAQEAELYYFQENAAKETFWKAIKENKPCVLCPAKTGDGKTFYAGQLLRWLFDCGFCSDEKNFSPWKVLYVTKATITEQTKEDLLLGFGLKQTIDVTVTNYEQLRAALGEMMIEDHVVVEDGIPRHIYKWRKFLHPLIFVWDECHSLKNEGAIQSQIAAAVNDLPEGSTFQLFMSATPFSRVAHAKCFAVATRKEFAGALGGKFKITNAEWPRIAKRIASPANPEDYCKAAIKRLLREFSDYIVPFRNVRRKHKSHLITEVMDFETEADKAAYRKAWEYYLEQKAKIMGAGDDLKNSRFLILVQFLKFRQAAELIRSFTMARRMYEAWHMGGFAPVYAANFKASIAKTVSILCSDFNVPRSKISLIWGGDAAYGGGGKDKLYTKEQIHDILAACIRGEDVPLKTLKTIQAQLTAEGAGLADLPAEYELGAQSRKERWSEIQKFQSGESQFCFFSYKSGGAGLSLHQNKPTLRPRKQFNSPTYNEMEMQQAEGRTLRLTSLSDVDIITMVYRGTIEVPVMQRVTAKRQCLNVVMGHGTDKVIAGEIADAHSRELEAIINMLDTRSEEEKRQEEEDRDIYGEDEESEE